MLQCAWFETHALEQQVKVSVDLLQSFDVPDARNWPIWIPNRHSSICVFEHIADSSNCEHCAGLKLRLKRDHFWTLLKVTKNLYRIDNIRLALDWMKIHTKMVSRHCVRGGGDKLLRLAMRVTLWLIIIDVQHTLTPRHQLHVREFRSKQTWHRHSRMPRKCSEDNQSAVNERGRAACHTVSTGSII